MDQFGRHASHKHYAYIVVSDWHWGARHPNPRRLARMLDTFHADTIVFNGDMIDGQYIELNGYRHVGEAEYTVMDALASQIARSTRVVVTPGNHDEKLRMCPHLWGKTRHGFELMEEFRFNMPGTGTPAVVRHGDDFERYVLHIDDAPRALSRFFLGGYTRLMRVADLIDTGLNGAFGVSFNFIAQATKAWQVIVGNKKPFLENMAAYARQVECGVMMTGHTHTPFVQKTTDGILLLNDGDGVENFSFIGITHDGKVELVYWHDYRKTLAPESPRHRWAKLEEAFRPATELLLSDTKAIWPGRTAKPGALPAPARLIP